MTRRPLTKLQRVRVFDRAHGRCHLCGLRIHAERGEKWEIEHIIALADGGTNDLVNLAPAHKACHRDKSDVEATRRAKTTRQRASYLGICGPGKGQGPKLPCGVRSNRRKTIKGRVIDRKSQAELHRDAMARRYGGFQ